MLFSFACATDFKDRSAEMVISAETDLRNAMLLDSETEHVELKEAKPRYDVEELVGYCCALSNEGGGSVVPGV